VGCQTALKIFHLKSVKIFQIFSKVIGFPHHLFPLFKSIRIIAGFQDIAVMNKAIEQRYIQSGMETLQRSFPQYPGKFYTPANSLNPERSWVRHHDLHNQEPAPETVQYIFGVLIERLFFPDFHGSPQG
jgi:hypothetical protein